MYDARARRTGGERHPRSARHRNLDGQPSDRNTLTTPFVAKDPQRLFREVHNADRLGAARILFYDRTTWGCIGCVAAEVSDTRPD